MLGLGSEVSKSTEDRLTECEDLYERSTRQRWKKRLGPGYILDNHCI